MGTTEVIFILCQAYSHKICGIIFNKKQIEIVDLTPLHTETSASDWAFLAGIWAAWGEKKEKRQHGQIKIQQQAS